MEGTALPLDDAIARARGGEVAAFGLIYERYSRPIHNYAQRILGHAAEADDITQETFLRAFQNVSKLRDDSRLESWLYSIASNLCFDLLRRRKLLSWLPLKQEHEEQAAKSDFMGLMAEGELVQKALSKMPPKYAACLVLRTVEGFSCEEIADILKISKGAVWTRLSRAREMFCKSYDELTRGNVS
ncbi:MAG: RNA polymerase sigma factor [Chloroflexi bacterium]|nr:RNA polymerase sigma factor [Chloroflexota bacterium]MDA8187391.1 RNA polymerase sigma factor [Dehalococcoidales bacterium]